MKEKSKLRELCARNRCASKANCICSASRACEKMSNLKQCARALYAQAHEERSAEMRALHKICAAQHKRMKREALKCERYQRIYLDAQFEERSAEMRALYRIYAAQHRRMKREALKCERYHRIYLDAQFEERSLICKSISQHDFSSYSAEQRAISKRSKR